MPKYITFKKRKSSGRIRPENVKSELERFVNEEAPELTWIVGRTTSRMQNEITYGDLANAIRLGYVDESWIRSWQQEYSELVRDHLGPAWETAITAAAHEVQTTFGLGAINITARHIREYVDHHSAEFVTNCTNTQREAMRAMIRRAAMTTDRSVDDLAMVIRPTIGLTRPQSNALVSYYEELRADGYTSDEAKKMQLKRAAKMHRQRAGVIAQYELADAYNAGFTAEVREAMSSGALPTLRKTISTSGLPNVCDVCAALEGVVVDWDGNFTIPENVKGKRNGKSSAELQKQLDKMFHKDRPPFHPNCLCSLKTEKANDYVVPPGDNTQKRQ
mgnify:CR=1 FL=1